MRTIKIMRIICAAILVIAVTWLGIKLYSSSHPYVAITILATGAIQAMANFVSAYSSKLRFEHLFMIFIASMFGAIPPMVTGACMEYGIWAVVIMAVPIILSLIPPMFYASKLELNKWQEPAASVIVLIAIFIWDWLERTPNYFSSIIAIEMLVVAFAVLLFPEKEKQKEEQA